MLIQGLKEGGNDERAVMGFSRHGFQFDSTMILFD